MGRRSQKKRDFFEYLFIFIQRFKDNRNRRLKEKSLRKSTTDSDVNFLVLSIQKHIDRFYEIICNKEKYINYSICLEWMANPVAEQADRVNEIIKSKKHRLSSKVVSSFNAQYDKYSFLRKTVLQTREDHNNDVRKNEIENHRGFFDTFSDHPLDPEQCTAVVTDDEHVLVNAGAGSGKTNVITAKVAYLIKYKNINPDKILLLSFTNEACHEMRKRIKEKTDCDIQVSTIHSFGFSILIKCLGYKPDMIFNEDDKILSRNSLPAYLQNLIDELMNKDKTFCDLIGRYFAENFLSCKTPINFNSYEDWRAYYKSIGAIYTLSDDRVKSIEEQKIADFLTQNGVSFVYETPYRYDVKTAQKRQYKPDFYLNEYDIYLEHFALDQNMEAPKWFKRGGTVYQAEYHDKLRLHQKFNTKLICTYSYEFMNNTWKQALEEKLGAHGVKLTKKHITKAKELINQYYVDVFISTLQTFLLLFKSGLHSFDDIHEAKSKYYIDRENQNRDDAFIYIFSIVYSEYEAFLLQNKQIDFSDMIKKAKEFVENDFDKLDINYDYIIVDEFQDTARGSLYLLQSILEKSKKTKLYCVGDDWQSIYRFNGSDVSLMQKYDKEFPGAKIVPLSTNYRSYPHIVNLGKDFVSKNPAQLKKNVKSFYQNCDLNLYDFEFIYLEEIQKHLSEIDKREDKATVQFLARYNKDIRSCYKYTPKDTYKSLSITLQTIHKSKGLEADYVFILPTTGRLAFPSKIADDNVLRLVKPETEHYPYAEERRLMYVAITRARKQVFFVINKKTVLSEFVEELEKMCILECAA